MFAELFWNPWAYFNFSPIPGLFKNTFGGGGVGARRSQLCLNKLDVGYFNLHDHGFVTFHISCNVASAIYRTIFIQHFKRDFRFISEEISSNGDATIDP